MSIFAVSFWKEAAERAVKTAAQSAVLVIGAEQVNALTVSWVEVGGFALGGAVLSLLTSIGSDYFNGGNGPTVGSNRILGKA